MIKSLCLPKRLEIVNPTEKEIATVKEWYRRWCYVTNGRWSRICGNDRISHCKVTVGKRGSLCRTA